MEPPEGAGQHLMTAFISTFSFHHLDENGWEKDIMSRKFLKISCRACMKKQIRPFICAS